MTPSMQKKDDDVLLRTPAKGIPLGELIEVDGEKYLHVKNSKREDDIKVNEMIVKLLTGKCHKK